MKNISYKIIGSVLFVLTIFSSCKKESENLFTMFDGLKIDFNESLDPNELYVEFKLEKIPATGAPMSKVVLTEAGGDNTPVYTVNVPFAQRYLYNSGVIVLTAPDPKTVNYIITVYDDGGNDITSQITKTYPAGKLVVNDPILATDKKTDTFQEGAVVYLDYTITSEKENIKSVNLYSFDTGLSTPADINIATVSDDAIDKRSYRGAVRLNLSRAGESRYRIYVKNEADDYIGDGYTHVNTNVEPKFDLAANKYLYGLDPLATTANPDFTTACFYSVSKKRTYSYNEAKESPEDVDFGIVLTPNPNSTTFPYNLIFYSIHVGPNVTSLVKFNFSDWAVKKNTKFSSGFGKYIYYDDLQKKDVEISAATLFLTNLSSGLAIQTWLGRGPLATGPYKNTVNKVNVLTSAGNMFFFQTQEGKYGAVYVNNFAKNYNGKWYANIDVKVEK